MQSDDTTNLRSFISLMNSLLLVIGVFASGLLMRTRHGGMEIELVIIVELDWVKRRH